MSQKGDLELSRRYRAASDQAPPAALDALIRAAAHSAATPARSVWRRKWGAPLALAASVVLGLGVVLRVAVERPDLQPVIQADGGGDKVTSPAAPAPVSTAPVAATPTPTPTPTESTVPPVLDRNAMQEPAPRARKVERPAAPLPEGKTSARSETVTGRPLGAVRDLRVDQAAKRSDAGASAAPTPAASSPAAVSRLPDLPPEVEQRAARDARQVLPAAREPAAAPADTPAHAGAVASNAPEAKPAPATPPPAAPRAASPQPPSVSAVPPPPPPPPPPPVTAPPAKPSIASVPLPDQAGLSERRAAPAMAAPAKALAPTETVAGANTEAGIEAEARLPPEEWLKRIIALRRGGRQVEAEASLRRFLLRYPDYRVPDQARAARR